MKRTAVILLGRRHLYLALALFQRSRSGDTDFEAAYQIGKTYQLLSEHELAEQHFRDALRFAPADWSARADAEGDLGTTLFEQHKFEEAETKFRESLRRKDSVDIRTRSISTAYILGKNEDVQRELGQLLKQPHPDPKIYLLAARVNLQSGNFPQTLVIIRQAVDDVPSESRGLFLDLARDLATGAISSYPPNPQTAKDALDLILNYKGAAAAPGSVPNNLSDAVAFLIRGRAKLEIAENNAFTGVDDAAKDMEQAKMFTDGQPPDKRSHELALVDLELAEAQFLDGKYSAAADLA